jgi:hypothetical protein
MNLFPINIQVFPKTISSDLVQSIPIDNITSSNLFFLYDEEEHKKRKILENRKLIIEKIFEEYNKRK